MHTRVCPLHMQDTEIDRLRNKTFALARDLPDIEALCRELETSAKQLTQAKAQAKRQHEHAMQLLSEKSSFEKQVTDLKQKAVEAKTAHDAQIQDKVLHHKKCSLFLQYFWFVSD